MGNGAAATSTLHLARARFSRCLRAMGLLLAVGAVVAGCWRNEQHPAPAKPESVTIAMPLTLAGALALLALEKHFFHEQGLNVTLRPMPTSAAAIDAVDRGQADFAMSSDTPFVFAVLDNKKVRLLARVFRSRTFVSIVARKDRGITRVADLARKRIGIVPGTASDYFFALYLEFQGIEPGEIARVALAADQVERALQNGEVDAVSIWHPHSTRLIGRLGPQAIVFNDPAIYQMRFNLIARPELASSRPEVARRFLLALQDALTFVRDNPQEAQRLSQRAIGEDPELFGKMWEDCDYTLTLDQSLLGGLESEARWALSRKRTARTTLPNFLEYVDVRPLQRVRPEAVSILLP